MRSLIGSHNSTKGLNRLLLFQNFNVKGNNLPMEILQVYVDKGVGALMAYLLDHITSKEHLLLNFLGVVQGLPL